MVIDQSTLDKIKVSLRIVHCALDEDIKDSISACIADLKVCGIINPRQDDPLILNAIKLYCKSEYTDDTGKAAAYKERYDALKACLMMASEYAMEVDP